MLFILLLGLSALLVAGSAAYFSVLGIATLFAGSYIQVLIMASALEFGKLVATSYLYRYWTNTVWWLKLYMIMAVLTLMGVTSIGIFGFLSAAYQVNSGKYANIDSQIELLEQQKNNADTELAQINTRIETLNKARLAQENRLTGLSRASAKSVYADIERAAAEIKSLSERTQELQQNKRDKDEQIINLKTEISKAKDIGTFKFISQSINKPLDTVVIVFICILIAVFDPLAVALVLAFNVATTGKILKTPPAVKKETGIKMEIQEEVVSEKDPEKENVRHTRQPKI